VLTSEEVSIASAPKQMIFNGTNATVSHGIGYSILHDYADMSAPTVTVWLCSIGGVLLLSCCFAYFHNFT